LTNITNSLAGFSPLHVAVNNGRIEEIESLLRTSPEMAALVDISKNTGQ
jgi:ankyrin repeat protein